jgi:hypothetical protein
MKSDRVSLTNEVLFWLWILLLMAIPVSSLNEEFKTIAQAPTVFLAAGAWIVVLVAGAIWFFMERFYRSAIDTLNERIKAKEEDLKRKDKQVSAQEKVIQEYKEALNNQREKPSDNQPPVPPTARPSLKDYSRTELSRVAKSIAAEIRKLVNERREIKDKTEEDLLQNDLAYGYEFAQKFQSLAISVRREIFSRVEFSDSFLREGYYATATFMTEIEEVAKDLERIAEVLDTF